MKKICTLAVAIAVLASCNNKKSETATSQETKPGQATNTTTENNTSTTPSSNNTQVTIDGKAESLSGSLLVTKDKSNLKPGLNHFVMLTAQGGNNSSLTLNFLIDTKPGTYPVVGMGYTRGDSDKGEVYGGLLGGQPKLTDYKVTLTDVKDLGDNGIGGHKWSISGSFDAMTIPAMGIMLMDKSRNHPAEIKIGGGSFSNLTFDDNWEEVMNKATEQLKEK